jgi:hypothetical protein
MNIKQILKDIEDNRDKLPESFVSGNYYSRLFKCYCIYGWLAKVTGGPDAAIAVYNYQESTKVSEHINKRYEFGHDKLDETWEEIEEADRIIDNTASAILAPAPAVIDTFIVMLEEKELAVT